MSISSNKSFPSARKTVLVILLLMAMLCFLTVILSSDYYYDHTENKASFAWNVGNNRLAISYGKNAKGSLLAKREMACRILDIMCDWSGGEDGNVHLEYANTVLSHKKEIQEDSRFGQYVVVFPAQRNSCLGDCYMMPIASSSELMPWIVMSSNDIHLYYPSDDVIESMFEKGVIPRITVSPECQ